MEYFNNNSIMNNTETTFIQKKYLLLHECV
jgi:hypothetical protein